MPPDSAELSDTELVARAQAGDRAAFAALYDQYSSRIYDLCAHMLRDPDAAADATAEVFLAAAEHLDQLTDPMKLKSWLYAIARNEVYRRGRASAYEAPVAQIDDFALPPAVVVDQMLDEPRAEPAGSAALLREASFGLADRDRLVLELTLAGGLDGRALGDALGVSVDAAHQASHRMRERLARSVGALLVARQGAAECTVLQGVLTEWDGTYSPIWRKRVARHVDRCAICGQRGKSVREKVLTGAFAALPLGFLTPPSWLRDRVLGDAALPPDVSGSPRGGRWRRRDGFPPLERLARRRRIAALVLGGAAVVLLIVSGSALLLADDGDRSIAVESRTSTTVGGNTAREAPSSVPGAPSVLAPGEGGTTSTTGAKVVVPPPTAAPDTTGPTLNVNVPSDFATPSVQVCSYGITVSANASDPSGIAAVTGTYTGASSSSFTLSPSGSGWTASVSPPNAGNYTFTITARDGAGNLTSVSRSSTGYTCIG